MVIIEIADNPNCPQADLRVFHEVEPARSVRCVRLERHPGEPVWYAVTGWMSEGRPCPALRQKVDDSGDGTAVLVHGGDAGLRLQPAGVPQPWGLDHPEQWGEPFLIMADAQDIQEAV